MSGSRPGRESSGQDTVKSRVVTLPLAQLATSWLKKEGGKDAVLAYISTSGAQAAWNVDVMGSPYGNNLNLLATPTSASNSSGASRESFVLQFASYNARQREAMNSLAKEAFSAKQHQSLPCSEIDPRDGEQTKLTVMELCSGGSLKDQARKVEGDEKKIVNIQHVIPQITSMLAKLKESNITWTDMKMGNILMRADNSIAISDFKGFCPNNMFEKRENGSLIFSDATSSYLSRSFIAETFENTKQDKVSEVWEKEHSYQLACIIHTMATGRERLNDHKTKKSSDRDFNFDDKVFHSVEGQRIGYIIRRLSADNPAERMDYNIAAKMMSVIGSQHQREYDALVLMDAKVRDLTKTKDKSSKSGVSIQGASQAASSADETHSTTRPDSKTQRERDYATPPARLSRAGSFKKAATSSPLSSMAAKAAAPANASPSHERSASPANSPADAARPPSPGRRPGGS